MGEHIIRYGVAFNRIQAPGALVAFAAFPQVGTTTSLVRIDIRHDHNLLIPRIALAWGTELDSPLRNLPLGYPGGGLADNRVEMYVWGRWKFRTNLTVTYGVHYVHDTGRMDSDLGALPDLNQWLPGLGIRCATRNLTSRRNSVLPGIGGNGKTVIRGGAGLFYENSIWNSTLLDNPARSRSGVFSYAPEVCSSGECPRHLPGLPVPAWTLRCRRRGYVVPHPDRSAGSAYLLRTDHLERSP